MEPTETTKSLTAEDVPAQFLEDVTWAKNLTDVNLAAAKAAQELAAV